MKCVVIKSLLATILAVGFVVATISTPAYAQEGEIGTTEGAPMGKLYLSASDAGYVSNLKVAPFVPFHVYLVAELDYSELGRADLNGSVEMTAYEAGVNIPGSGSDVIVSDAVIRNELISIYTNTNLLVGLMPALIADAQPTWIVHYTMIVMNPANVSDAMITLGPTSPSSFHPERPGFAEGTDLGECVRIFDGAAQKCIRPFAVLGNLSLNCSTSCIDERPVAVESTTWSRVKANFEG